MSQSNRAKPTHEPTDPRLHMHRLTAVSKNFREIFRDVVFHQFIEAIMEENRRLQSRVKELELQRYWRHRTPQQLRRMLNNTFTQNRHSFPAFAYCFCDHCTELHGVVSRFNLQATQCSTYAVFCEAADKHSITIASAASREEDVVAYTKNYLTTVSTKDVHICFQVPNDWSTITYGARLWKCERFVDRELLHFSRFWEELQSFEIEWEF